MKYIGFNLSQVKIPGLQTKHSARNWLARLGLFSLCGGAVSLLAGSDGAVSASDTPNKGRIAQLPEKEKETRKRAVNNSKRAELLRRQSEFRLPFGQTQPTASAMPPPDDCPGTIVPPGSYTPASPYTAAGDTTGANDTVTNFDGGYYYSYSSGPDHVYTFTLTAVGANPRIKVTTATGGYNSVTYVLNGLKNARCPSGTSNTTYSVRATSGDQQGVIEMSLTGVPLNVPLHLFVDSYSGSSAYTVQFEDVTVGPTTVPPENDAPLDLNGDGKTDFPIVRNTGGGPGGQLTWFTRTSNNQFLSTATWGVEGDKAVSGDFDGDGRDDLAVWRPGTQGRFYIIGSRTQTIRIEDFGQTGDDPTIVHDYDLDGIDDIAVYRPGATPGAQSYWYYRSVSSSPSGDLTRIPWGQHGDRPVPGNFSVYGSVLVVQRGEGPNGRFFVRYPWGSFETTVFGLAGDMLVPGDYDGDGRTDLAVARPTDDGFLAWHFRSSSEGSSAWTSRLWGVAATDTIVQADYNGDGRTDLAVWRPGSPGAFYIRDWDTGRIDIVPWGETGDVPVASFNKH